MSIPFGRLGIISRGRGQALVTKFEYLGRLGAFSAHKDLLAGPMTLHPFGGKGPKGRALWQCADGMESRANAVLGVDIVGALPLVGQMPLHQQKIAVRRFGQALSDEHSVSVSVGIHAGHAMLPPPQPECGATSAKMVGERNLNEHFHLQAGRRQTRDGRLNEEIYRGLEPLVGQDGGVVDAVPVGRIWANFLNGQFAAFGLPTRTRLPVPFASHHIGPRRAAGVAEGEATDGRRPANPSSDLFRLNKKTEAKNRKAILEPGASLANALTGIGFRHRDLIELVARYSDRQGSDLARQADRIAESIDLVEFADPVTGDPTGILAGEKTCRLASRIFSFATGDTRPLSDLADFRRSDWIETILNGRRLEILELGEADPSATLVEMHEGLVEAGLRPVHIAHNACTIPHDAPLIRNAAFVAKRLPHRLPDGDVWIIDRADALTIRTLAALASAAEGCAARLVLVRRPPTPLWPVNGLVESLVSLCGTTHMPGPAPAPDFGRAIGSRDYNSAVMLLDRMGRLAWTQSVEDLRSAALDTLSALERAGRRGFILCGDPEVTQLLAAERVHAAKVPMVGPNIAERFKGEVIALHTPPATDHIPVVPQLSAAEPHRLTVLAARDLSRDVGGIISQCRIADGDPFGLDLNIRLVQRAWLQPDDDDRTAHSLAQLDPAKAAPPATMPFDFKVEDPPQPAPAPPDPHRSAMSPKEVADWQARLIGQYGPPDDIDLEAVARAMNRHRSQDSRVRPGRPKRAPPDD